MIKIFSSRKAQNLTELALLIGVVAMVFISMEVYFKRGLQSKIKNMTDNYMTSGVLGGGNLVWPANQEIYATDMHNYAVLNAKTTTNSSSTVNVATLAGGGTVATSQVDMNVPASSSHSEATY
ncbi:MAG: hypothetical protein ABSE81_07075 [Candidatus Omnitrophota bacterium]|jgi:uncharacterized protein (UPF0333 family)